MEKPSGFGRYYENPEDRLTVAFGADILKKSQNNKGGNENEKTVSDPAGAVHGVPHDAHYSIGRERRGSQRHLRRQPDLGAVMGIMVKTMHSASRIANSFFILFSSFGNYCLSIIIDAELHFVNCDSANS